MFLINSTYLDVGRAPGEDEVVWDDGLELGEVPAVPLLDAHGEGVDVLVHLIQQRDRLDDHVVCATRIELNLHHETQEG